MPRTISKNDSSGRYRQKADRSHNLAQPKGRFDRCLQMLWPRVHSGCSLSKESFKSERLAEPGRGYWNR